MHAGDAVFFVCAIPLVLQTIFEPMVFGSWTLFDTWGQLIFTLVVLVFTALAYHEASGEDKRRIGWVIAGFALAALSYSSLDILEDLSTMGPPNVPLIAASQLLSCALPIALAYAILKHRVLDIGFAFNRTVVYAVMTTLVVGVVSLADWLTSRLIDQQRLALAVEALVTISFGFALNWIHRRTERIIDRVVFRSRHVAEKRIEYRIGALGFASSADAIDDALAGDAAAILDLASAAVFSRISPSAPFRRGASARWPQDATLTIGSDAVLVRTLRSLERPFFLDEAAISPESLLPGPRRPVLAIPITAQHELIGFVLYGNHYDGASPDPEEVSLLARLAAAAGNAYGAVEARQWRERVASLEESLREITVPSLPG